MTDNEKENITVEAEEVNDFQEFKNKLKDRFTKKKKSKWHVVKGKIIAITPLVALATFLLIGFLADTWHPTWLVFLACPFVPIFLSLFDGGKKEKIVAFVSVVISVAYLLVGFLAHIWHPTWVAFLLIPITAILIGSDKE
ncbi:MAG: hypothetical protein J6W25_03155 [Bacilli bacterium]|nr:hypothetical protein [Bacilli bacterium]MBP5550467.1 hypothetical protein [Bacilli bacterium]